MLENKVALVTGAGRGIGRAIAIALAKEGAEVVVNYNGSEERAKEVKQTIEENGGKASIYKCNVSDFEACEAMIKDIVKEHGRLDILINNAGITKDGLIMKRTIRRLSKGMQKQVAFWLAICCKPDLLILDEPVDGLDPVMRRQIWSILMAEVAERKMTVLVSSHNLRELEDTCDHVGIMHHGKIMIERSLSDLQGNISKIQVACQNGVPKLPDDFEVLHMANTGRVYTLIVKGDPKEAEKVLLTENPTIVDVLPLTLEEIFIYELGGVDYEVKDILL